MRLITIILALTFLSILHLQGQSVWAPPGAKWYYSYAHFADRGYVTIEYVQDSTINGKLCKGLEKKRYRYSNISGITDSVFLGLVYTYLENDSVYYYNNNQFHLLYDLSAQAGDDWDVDTLVTIHVDSIGSMNVSGYMLNWIGVHSSSVNNYGISGKIVNRLGAIDHYMFPEHLADGHEGGAFRCYYDNQIGLYHDAFSQPCDYITSLNQLTVDEKEVSVYPNPFSSSFRVQLKGYNNENILFLLYTLDGRRVFEKEFFNANEITVRPTNLQSGLYIYKLVLKNSIINSGKILVK